MTQLGLTRRSVLLAGAAMAACGGGSDIPEVLSVVINDHGPIFRSLTVELAGPADVEVEYGTTHGERLRVQTSSPALSRHDIPLPRLRAQSTYAYRLRVRPGARQPWAAAVGEFTTAALPADLAALSFARTGTLSAPLLFLSVRSSFTGGVMLDQAGQIVWYCRSNGAPQGAFGRANGHWVMVNGRGGLEEFDVHGRVVATLAHTQLSAQSGIIHHGVAETRDGKILLLAFDPRTIDGQTRYGENLWLWSGDSTPPVKVWSAFDHLDPAVYFGPRSIPTDWLHANHVSIGPRGDVYVSFHFIDKVISIAPDFGSIQWQLGGPNSTFALEPDQVFSGQHSAREVAPGRVLLFDNGYARADGSRWSRLIEFELDVGSRRARTAWQYRPEPDIWASIISSVRRLDNGNTLGTFGTPAGLQGSTGPVTVHEVSPAGQLLASVDISGPDRTTVFQGDAATSIGGEAAVM